MIRYCYILLMCLIASISFGQSKQVLLLEANYYFSQQDFYAASHFYELSYQKDSGDVEQWWQMAEAYRFTFQYDLAAQFYHKVYLEDGSLNYPDVQLWEGLCLNNRKIMNERLRLCNPIWVPKLTLRIFIIEKD